MTTVITPETTVGQLVVDRPSRSRIFQKLGIDFCCGGKKSLAAVCEKKGLDARSVLQVLLASESDAASPEVDAAKMGLAELCDHIEATHHAHLRDELPRLHRMIHKVAAVHGDHHPWMREVLEVYVPFMDELIEHMAKEDQVLFPMIRTLETGRAGVTSESEDCGGSIGNPIRMMEHEHDGAGDALAKIRELTDGFTPPHGACNTFRATLDGLRELEADMHQHVHKENNVLFPRALALEAETAAAA